MTFQRQFKQSLQFALKTNIAYLDYLPNSNSNSNKDTSAEQSAKKEKKQKHYCYIGLEGLRNWLLLSEEALSPIESSKSKSQTRDCYFSIGGKLLIAALHSKKTK